MFESWLLFWQSLRANPTLLALLLLSVGTLAVGLERLAWLWRLRRRLRHATGNLAAHLAAGHAQSARALNRSLPAHAATSLLDAFLAAPGGQPVASLVRRPLLRLQRQARRRLWLVGSTASIAPFVGLLGTVLGIMKAFEAMGQEPAGGFHVVSHGISEALVTTAAGIFVAVEALALFNGLQVLVAGTMADLQESLEGLADARAAATAPGGAPAHGQPEP